MHKIRRVEHRPGFTVERFGLKRAAFSPDLGQGPGPGFSAVFSNEAEGERYSVQRVLRNFFINRFLAAASFFFF